MKVSYSDFYRFLTEIIPETFPETEMRIVFAGDDRKDLVVELIEDGKSYRYSPLELYRQSEAFEDTVCDLMETWLQMLKQ